MLGMGAEWSTAVDIARHQPMPWFIISVSTVVSYLFLVGFVVHFAIIGTLVSGMVRLRGLRLVKPAVTRQSKAGSAGSPNPDVHQAILATSKMRQLAMDCPDSHQFLSLAFTPREKTCLITISKLSADDIVNHISRTSKKTTNASPPVIERRRRSVILQENLHDAHYHTPALARALRRVSVIQDTEVIRSLSLGRSGGRQEWVPMANNGGNPRTYVPADGDGRGRQSKQAKRSPPQAPRGREASKRSFHWDDSDTEEMKEGVAESAIDESETAESAPAESATVAERAAAESVSKPPPVATAQQQVDG